MLLIRIINNYIGQKIEDFVVSCCIKNKCKAYRQFITNINIPFYDFLKVKSNYNIAYHGTPSVENAYDICCNSWDVSKRNGQVHGRGEYFTTNILTAQQYATCNGAIVVALIIAPSYNNNIKIIDKNDAEQWYVVDNTEHHKYVLPLGILKYKINIDNNGILCRTLQQKNFDSSYHHILPHSKPVEQVNHVVPVNHVVHDIFSMYSGKNLSTIELSPLIPTSQICDSFLFSGLNLSTTEFSKINNVKKSCHQVAGACENSNKSSDLMRGKMLIQAKTKLDLQNKDGWISLMLASRNSNTCSNVETVKLLIEAYENSNEDSNVITKKMLISNLDL